jgi:hypothetical protein
MTFANTPKSREGKSSTVTRAHCRRTVDPLRHQIGRYVSEVVPGKRQTWISGEVVQVRKGTNLDDVLNFFDYTSHQVDSLFVLIIRSDNNAEWPGIALVSRHSRMIAPLAFSIF